jgi:signal peptidase I
VAQFVEVEFPKPSYTMKLKTINYWGCSMNPTLKSGDGLEVVPWAGTKIRCGDVIVFFSPEGCQKITHRVISVNSKGVRTRGDNNKSVDPWVLTPVSIIGRVVYAQRGNKRRKVFGGPTGQLCAVGGRARKVLDMWVTSLLHHPYHWMVRIGILGRLIQRQIKLKVISLNRPEGIELQLLMGRRVIGRLLRGRKKWYIQRPFRLFLDESTLPENPLQM